MPTIYRAMKQTDDGLPAVGSGSSELGVRLPPNPNADIEVDDDGSVILNGNGMSVVENWRSLLPHLVPKRLKPIFPGATGSNKLACFRFGEGPFSPAPLNDRLSLTLKRHDVRAGNVVPAQPVSSGQFQEDLAATRAGWVVDEA